MTKEEMQEVFEYIEKKFNKQGILVFVMEDRNQITGYLKSSKKRFCQFYINRILELLKGENND